MKFIATTAALLISTSVFAGDTSESIAKQYLANELDKAHIITEMKAAGSQQETKHYTAQLEEIGQFSDTHVKINSTEKTKAHGMSNFAKKLTNWSKGLGIDYSKLEVKTMLEEETNDYASIDLVVEKNRCNVKMNKENGVWKITKEMCSFLTRS